MITLYRTRVKSSLSFYEFSIICSIIFWTEIKPQFNFRLNILISSGPRIGNSLWDNSISKSALFYKVI